MAFTATGASPSTTAAAIVAAALSGVVYADAVNNAISTLGWCPVGTQAFINGTLVKVTTSASAGGAPVFSYDTSGAVT